MQHDVDSPSSLNPYNFVPESLITCCQGKNHRSRDPRRMVERRPGSLGRLEAGRRLFDVDRANDASFVRDKSACTGGVCGGHCRGIRVREGACLMLVMFLSYFPIFCAISFCALSLRVVNGDET